MRLALMTVLAFILLTTLSQACALTISYSVREGAGVDRRGTILTRFDDIVVWDTVTINGKMTTDIYRFRVDSAGLSALVEKFFVIPNIIGAVIKGEPPQHEAAFTLCGPMNSSLEYNFKYEKDNKGKFTVRTRPGGRSDIIRYAPVNNPPGKINEKSLPAFYSSTLTASQCASKFTMTARGNGLQGMTGFE